MSALRAEIARLQASVGALAAIGAALDARVSGVALDPALGRHVDDVVRAVGLADAIDAASPAELEPMLGEIRALTLTDTRLLFARTRQPAGARRIRTSCGPPATCRSCSLVGCATCWRRSSTVSPPASGRRGRCSSTSARGWRGCRSRWRLWPSLRVVGIDPFAPALAIARETVRAASLEDRITLREQAGEDLSDRDQFDLAWVAGAFVPPAVVPPLLERVRAALRPGTWLLYATVRPVDDPLTAALGRLRCAQFAGSYLGSEELLELLRARGFADLRVFPGPQTSFTALVAAPRAVSLPRTTSPSTPQKQGRTR